MAVPHLTNCGPACSGLFATCPGLLRVKNEFSRGHPTAWSPKATEPSPCALTSLWPGALESGRGGTRLVGGALFRAEPWRPEATEHLCTDLLVADALRRSARRGLQAPAPQFLRPRERLAGSPPPPPPPPNLTSRPPNTQRQGWWTWSPTVASPGGPPSSSLRLVGRALCRAGPSDAGGSWPLGPPAVAGSTCLTSPGDAPTGPVPGGGKGLESVAEGLYPFPYPYPLGEANIGLDGCCLLLLVVHNQQLIFYIFF